MGHIRRYASFLCLLVILSSDAAWAQQQVQPTRPDFAGIVWGESVAEATDKLVKIDFTEKESFQQSGLSITSYSGRALSEEARVEVVISPKYGIQKVIVTLITPDSEAVTKYADVSRMLVRKYGKVDSEVEFYQRPFEEGDGYEETAIRSGKGHLMTLWKVQDCTVASKVTDKLNVMITYEGPAWAAVVDAIEAADEAAF